MHNHIEPFIVARSYAPSSAKQRRFLLQQFCDTVGDDMSVEQVYRWWASIGHLSEATRRAHLSAVRQFVAHLIVVGVTDSDPTVSISPPRIHHDPPVTITPVEAVRFLACISNLRDRVAAALMLGCGLRAGDVARLDVDHIDLVQRIARVPGKGGKVRLVPIPDVVAGILHTHLAGSDSGALIRTSCGHRLTAEQLRARLTAELYRAGIKHGPHDGRSSHVLRRTCATTLLEHGATIVDVQAVLGHVSLASTQRYMAVPDVKRLLSVIESGPLASTP
jgi:integrase/recombinase XerC